MSVLVLQPSLTGGARRRHVRLVPVDAPYRRPRHGWGPRPAPASPAVPLALVGAPSARPVRSRTAPAAVVRPVRDRGSIAGACLHVTRRGRLALTVSTLLLVGGVALLAAALVPGGITTAPATAAAATVVPATTEVVVLPGDTLWSLADEVAGPGEDVRDVVLRIEQLNELVSADVAIGDRLRVPA